MRGWASKAGSAPFQTGCPLDEVVSTQPFYIATPTAPTEERRRVLKYGAMFAVFDRFGDIEPFGVGDQGIFFNGTRHLSEYLLYIGECRPLLLSSSIRPDNALFSADLANVDLVHDGEVIVPRGSLHVARTKFLWRGAVYEQFRLSNYGLCDIDIPFRLDFSADFADIFEVRGSQRARRGQKLDPEVSNTRVVLRYLGLDEVLRRTEIRCSTAPARITRSELRFDTFLRPREHMTLEIAIACDPETDAAVLSYDAALTEFSAEFGTPDCTIISTNERFTRWAERSAADVEMMVRGNPERDYPYAGVPWFSTVFGRDGIITALECLWLSPHLAEGVLQYLAATQATDFRPDSDAEPGKIVHEIRKGEMAALGEVPFGCYYGSVDSTPLFVMLAGEYYDRTGNREFIAELWPSVVAALRWIDKYGDVDDDGFVEYHRQSSTGLVQQGWKDSSDSVFHADGSLAEPPIALCEVQGYVYAAKSCASRLAAALGEDGLAADLESQARELKERFEEAFWCDDLSMYALALDGKKRPCKVRTSNAGHCLFTGIASPSRALRLAQALSGADFFSGWGVRTVALSEPRYNPISYHNGSIWPHDNALIASGMSRYGFQQLSSQIFTALLDVSANVEMHRLPELFCGLPRRRGEGPTLYPVACSPQAWSAGAVFLLLRACLGISISGAENTIVFHKPLLPEALPKLWIKGLCVGASVVDLYLQREPEGVRIEVLQEQGSPRIEIR